MNKSAIYNFSPDRIRFYLTFSTLSPGQLSIHMCSSGQDVPNLDILFLQRRKTLHISNILFLLFSYIKRLPCINFILRHSNTITTNKKKTQNAVISRFFAVKEAKTAHHISHGMLRRHTVCCKREEEQPGITRAAPEYIFSRLNAVYHMCMRHFFMSS